MRWYAHTDKKEKRNMMGKAGCHKIAKHLPSNQSYCGIPPHYPFQIFGFDQTHGLCKFSFKKKNCLLLACSLETSPLSGLDSKIICTDSLLSTTNLHKKKHHTAGSVGAAVRNALLWYPYVPGTKQQRVLILRGVCIINLILKRGRWVERAGYRLMYWSRVHLALSSFY